MSDFNFVVLSWFSLVLGGGYCFALWSISLRPLFPFSFSFSFVSFLSINEFFIHRSKKKCNISFIMLYLNPGKQ